MARLPKAFLNRRVKVERYLGTWGSYAGPVELPCAIQEGLTGAVKQAGLVRVASVTLTAAVDAVCPPGSKVTLPDGRKGYAGAVAVHDTGTPAPIDHTEIAVTIGAEFGPPLGGVTVTLLRRTLAPGKDRYGNDRYTTTAIEVPGCAVRALSSQERVDNGESPVTDSIEVLMPPGTEVRSTDQLRARGLLYEVDGTPDEQTDPMTGVQPGVRVVGRRITGG